MNLFSNRFRRLTAILAALLFLAASTVYASHEHAGDAQSTQSQCDYCLQFNATATPPAVSVLLCPVELVSYVSVLDLESTFLAQRKVRAHGSRAPPLFSTI